MEVPAGAPPGPAVLSVPLDAAALRRCSLWLEGICRERGVPEEAVGRLDLCLNEVLANLMDHGGAAGMDAPVELEIVVARRATEVSATLTVVDRGLPFDPVAFRPKDLPRSLAEAEPGGLGLRLMRRFADDIGYRRRDGCNVLRLTVRSPSGTGGGGIPG